MVRDKWVKHIVAVVKDVRAFKIELGEDLTGVKPTEEPYSRTGSYEFFMDVKRGNLGKVEDALIMDRFLAHAHNEME